MAKNQISEAQLKAFKSKLGPVKDLSGKPVTAEDDFIVPVEFEARGRIYTVLVQTNAYSTGDVLAFQAYQEKVETANRKSEARKALEKLLTDFPADYSTDQREIKRLIRGLHDLAELIPETDATTDRTADFKENVKFLMIGALAWNVEDIELSEDGVIGGDVRVGMAAVEAITKTINPTSTVEEKAGPSDENSLSTGSPSTETAAA